MPPPKPTPKFLQRIKDNALDRIQKRVREELAPKTPDQEDAVPIGIVDKAKEKARDWLGNLSPVQRRMLDPATPLDMSTLKYRIQYCARNHLLAFVGYNGVMRHLEIYSYRTNGIDAQGKKGALRLYARCRLHDQIHSFKLENIQSFIVTNETYSEKWPIEIG